MKKLLFIVSLVAAAGSLHAMNVRPVLTAAEWQELARRRLDNPNQTDLLVIQNVKDYTMPLLAPLNPQEQYDALTGYIKEVLEARDARYMRQMLEGYRQLMSELVGGPEV